MRQKITLICSRAAMMLLVMMLTSVSAWADGVDYIDADGTVKNTATDDINGNETPTVINSKNMPTTSLAGWYVVNDDITYTSGITLSGNVHIILANGATMSIGTSTDRINGVGINNGSSLTIYGQSTDATTMGTLSIYTSAKNKHAINTGVITINGGHVTANANGVFAYALRATSTNINGGIVSVTATGTGAFAIDTRGNTVITGGTVEATSTNASAIYARDNGNVTISGGNVIARAGGNAIAGNNLTISGGNVEATTTSRTTPAIYSRGDLALGWTNSTDCIKASNYYVEGTISVASGKAFCDGTTVYSDTNSSDISALAGKTLMPAIICGKTANDNVYWAFNSTTHTLNIAGTGAMADYDDASNRPWNTYASDITSISIGEGVTSIGKKAFENCSGLASVTFADGSQLESIGNYAFYLCNNASFTSITIPSGVKTIGNGAFLGCTGLASVNIPSSVTSIGSEAFFGCSGLTSITIGSGVTSIGSHAFYGCSGLTSITIWAPSLNNYGSSAFVNCNSSLVICVPAGSIDEYAAGWSSYASKLKATWSGNNITSGDFAGYWSTYYNSGCNVTVDENTDIYYISAVNGTSATLTENTDDKVITAGKAVLLKSTAENVTMTYSADASGCTYTDNSLTGVDAATTCEANANYTLAGEGGTLGFYKYTGTTLAANKAYLPGATVGSAREFYLFDLDDEEMTTGVADVRGKKEDVRSGEYFNLNGQRISKPTKKGLYIVNGKKILVR